MRCEQESREASTLVWITIWFWVLRWSASWLACSNMLALGLVLLSLVAEPCCSSIVCAVPLSELSAVKSTYAGVPGVCAGALPGVGVFGNSVLGVILLSTIGGHPLDQSSSGAVVAICMAFGFQYLLLDITIVE